MDLSQRKEAKKSQFLAFVSHAIPWVMLKRDCLYPWERTRCYWSKWMVGTFPYAQGKLFA
jgi:hypothetical protein